MYFEISTERADSIIRHYEGIAKIAATVAEKLRAECLKAEQEGRPINKGRMLAICRWYGQVPKHPDGPECEPEGIATC
jgi:hypothetical protein